MRNKELLTKAFLKEANIDGDEKEWYCRLWRNLRKNNPSMRLTKDGYNFLTKQVQLKEYRIKMPSDMNMNAQVTLDIDRFIDCPYWIAPKKTHIHVFAEKKATELALFAGDIAKYGRVKAKNNLKNQ